MKIAITAANGQLGSSVVKELLRQVGRDQLVGIVRTPAKAQHLDIEIRKGDYSDREAYQTALKGIDTVLLISGMDAPYKRIQQHRNVIEAAKQNGVKKIVYTSIIGSASQTAFSPIVQSNRQTEQDIKNSGLKWVIGRNGIYIEPDLEYIDSYQQEGVIRNCAEGGKCGYTSRSELSVAYCQLLLDDYHNGNTYNLAGPPISQNELASCINEVYGTTLSYQPVSVSDYTSERKAALGDFLGSVIAGIYEGIKIGANDVVSDFEKASGRPHLAPIDMIKNFKNQ